MNVSRRGFVAVILIGVGFGTLLVGAFESKFLYVTLVCFALAGLIARYGDDE